MLYISLSLGALEQLHVYSDSMTQIYRQHVVVVSFELEDRFQRPSIIARRWERMLESELPTPLNPTLLGKQAPCLSVYHIA